MNVETLEDPLGRIRNILVSRRTAGLWRRLVSRPAEEQVLDLAGNDYLGFARDPRVREAAASASATWGAGSTGSRLVTGTTDIHTQLEVELAGFLGAPSALVFSCGYLANIGLLAALGGPDVTIVSDRLNHASIVDACRLSRSSIAVVPHHDIDSVDVALSERKTQHSIVVTDAVFSVDGDLAPLRELHRVARRHGSLVVVDEAHSLGVVGLRGEGAVAEAGLSAAPDVIRTVTLSKSLGAQGGAVVGATEVIDLLVNTARPVIFDTGLAPPAVGAALAALRLLVSEPHRPENARVNALAVAEILVSLGVETPRPAAAVVPAFLGDPWVALSAAARCLEAGVRVGCFRPPTVPEGRSCLRLSIRSDLTTADLDVVRTALTQALIEEQREGP